MKFETEVKKYMTLKVKTYMKSYMKSYLCLFYSLKIPILCINGDDIENHKIAYLQAIGIHFSL